jgi:hypothetical protein
MPFKCSLVLMQSKQIGLEYVWRSRWERDVIAGCQVTKIICSNVQIQMNIVRMRRQIPLVSSWEMQKEWGK